MCLRASTALFVIIFATTCFYTFCDQQKKDVGPVSNLIAMSNFFFKIGIAYERLATKHPLKVNCVTGFIIASVGDIGCQVFDKTKANNWNKVRTMEMGLIRAFIVTPFIVNWYPFLASTFPGKAISTVACRVLVDQMIGSPIVITLVFFSSTFFNLKPPSVAIARMQENFFVTWKKGLQFWPFVHSFNFGFVSQVYQPLFAHVASLYWNMILSYYSNTKLKSD